MTRPLALRVATGADATAIAEFQTTCWREAYVGLVPQDYLDSVGVADRQQRWSTRILERERSVLIAEADGAIAGVASLGLSNDRRELMSLYVSAGRRGSGLAQQLLDATIGAEPAHVWVFEGNERAIGFYARNGFVPDGVRMTDPDTNVVCIGLARSQRDTS